MRRAGNFFLISLLLQGVTLPALQKIDTLIDPKKNAGFFPIKTDLIKFGNEESGRTYIYSARDAQKRSGNPKLKEHVRRAEIIFFIALPFTSAYSYVLMTQGYYFAQTFSATGQIIARGGSGAFEPIAKPAGGFTFFPEEGITPGNVFIWVNACLWAYAIANNDYNERKEPNFRQRMAQNGFIHMNLLHFRF